MLALDRLVYVFVPDRSNHMYLGTHHSLLSMNSHPLIRLLICLQKKSTTPFTTSNGSKGHIYFRHLSRSLHCSSIETFYEQFLTSRVSDQAWPLRLTSGLSLLPTGLLNSVLKPLPKSPKAFFSIVRPRT